MARDSQLKIDHFCFIGTNRRHLGYAHPHGDHSLRRHHRPKKESATWVAWSLPTLRCPVSTLIEPRRRGRHAHLLLFGVARPSPLEEHSHASKSRNHSRWGAQHKAGRRRNLHRQVWEADWSSCFVRPVLRSTDAKTTGRRLRPHCVSPRAAGRTRPLGLDHRAEPTICSRLRMTGRSSAARRLYVAR